MRPTSAAWPAALLLAAAVIVPAAAGAGATIYAVRHAEKRLDAGDRDPPLTQPGRARAEQLARMLRSVDLRAIYVTRYRRTQETAAPAAVAAGIAPHVVEPAALADSLRARTDGAVLVVGHSNTLPDLVRALSGIEIVIADDAYDDVFVLTRCEGAAYRVQHLHYEAAAPPGR